MSKPTQTPKQNFLQTALLMAVIFLGFQLFFNRPPDTRTSAEILTAMRELNAKNAADQIQGLESAYHGKIADEERQRRITPEEAQRKRLESLILVADTQLKAGIARNSTHYIQLAYMGMESPQRREGRTKDWNEHRVEVADVRADERFGWNSWTAAEVFEKTSTILSQRNKTDLVWGFIPGYQLIDALVHMSGAVPSLSYALAAFILALVVRALIFPLAQKQLMFGRQMSQLMPLIAELKEKYKDKPQEQQIKIMELYKEYGINPLSGCFPALIQLPLFFAIYQCMLLYRFEFAKGTFLWINPQLSEATGGFISPNLGLQDTLLVVFYGVTMVISTMLTPVSDPSNARQQRILGISFSVMIPGTMLMGLFPVPSAFVLYWTFTNLFATAQSLRAYRLPMPPLVKVNAPTGGVYPVATNGKTQPPVNGKGGGIAGTHKTGKPVKHKPKKRK